MKRVLVVLLSLVLLGSLTVAQAADEQKTAPPAQGRPMIDHQMMKGGDGKMMMDCPMMKGGDGKMMMNCQMMMDGDGKGMMGGMMKQHHMMMRDMMQMMKDTMTIQKQMLASPTAEAKMKMETNCLS